MAKDTRIKCWTAAWNEYLDRAPAAGMGFEQWRYEKMTEKPFPFIDWRINSSKDAAQLFIDCMPKEDIRERMFVLPLDAANCPICAPFTISEGLLNGVPLGAREVFTPAIWWQANAVIMAHNHPSGDPTPSSRDVEVTRKILAASRILQIPLIDHIVIGDDRFVSIRKDRLVKWKEDAVMANGKSRRLRKRNIR